MRRLTWRPRCYAILLAALDWRWLVWTLLLLLLLLLLLCAQNLVRRPCFDLHYPRPITRRPLRSFCPQRLALLSSLSHLFARLSNHTCEDSVHIQEHPRLHPRCALESICILRHANVACLRLTNYGNSFDYHESVWSEELSRRYLGTGLIIECLDGHYGLNN
jgi:hypothetical protein